MTVLCRHAKDDFDSLMTAQGMEDAGASVFSIVSWVRGLVIFCKYEDVEPDYIDQCIAKRMLR